MFDLPKLIIVMQLGKCQFTLSVSLEPTILSKFFVSLYDVIRNHICYCPIEFILRAVSLQFYIRLTFTCVEEYV